MAFNIETNERKKTISNRLLLNINLLYRCICRLLTPDLKCKSEKRKMFDKVTITSQSQEQLISEVQRVKVFCSDV